MKILSEKKEGAILEIIRPIGLFLLMIVSFTYLSAQNKITLVSVDTLPKGVSFEKRLADRVGAERQANKIVGQLLNRGYLAASVDTLWFKNDSAFVKIFTGNPFSWGRVDYQYLPKPMLKQFGFETATKGLTNVDALKKSMTQTISYFENRGYPFAYFYWDSLIIRNDSIIGSLYFEKNILITFDTLALYGDGGLSKKFLYNYLDFKPDDPYDESIVSQLNDRLTKLPFSSVVAKPQVFFVGRKAVILLNLKKRKTDRLDGLIGFAPNTGTPGNTKLLVTGEFHLDFKNLRGSGRGFKIDWQSFRARSQTLNVGLNLPYLLNQPIGAEISADFLKYDTIYTETRFGIGAQYIFSGLDNVKVFYEQKNTNVEFADTTDIRLNRKLGQLVSMKTARYGLGLNSVTFDNRVSPKKGYQLDMNASIFSRVIQKDERINRVKFYDESNKAYFTVYDSMKLKSYQFLLQYNLAKPLLLFKRVVLFSELKGYHFFSPAIYFNELYRFGGNNTFKGFNEQSLFASSLSIINLEVRYLLSENSFLKLFGNAAYYNNKSNQLNKIDNDFPYGFGGVLIWKPVEASST